ncbi:hypothetical protein BH20ACT19_BH20ACT19_05880 [soil metagenome]
MSWAAAQEEMWALVGEGEPPAPSGDQTLEQAVHFNVEDFLRCCDFDSVPRPPRAEVEARMRAMLPAAVR